MIKKFYRLLEVTGVVFFTTLTLLVLFQVLMRKVFNASPPWTEELARYATIWSTLILSALLIGEKGHIILDYFVEKAPPRIKKAIHIFVGILTIFLAAAFAYGGAGMIKTSMSVNQLSPGAGIPMWIIYIILPLSGLLMVFSQTLITVDILRSKSPDDKGNPPK